MNQIKDKQKQKFSKKTKTPNKQRFQPRKDSNTKRVNFDNERLSKFERSIVPDTSNDPQWYATNAELMKAAGSIPFSNTTGAELGFKGYNSISLPNKEEVARIPGVCSYTWIPSLGGGNTDAINAAKDSLYSYVVHANSRNTSYTSADLMLTIVAGMQVFSFLAAGIRAYGTMRLYDQRNRYLPNALITAMGFDFNDLRENLPNMWFELNHLIAQTKQIWIPNTMPVLSRWFWMNSEVYMDSESVKGQYYMYTQSKFLQLNETANPTGTSLSWVKYSDGSNFSLNAKTRVKWSQYIDIAQRLISSLVNSEDRGIMMGDILKAYGADKIYAINPISSEYAIIPSYNREVLSQMENCTPTNPNYMEIFQDADGRILQGSYNPFSAGSTAIHLQPRQRLINFHFPEPPTPEQIMVATRMMTAGSIYSTDYKTKASVGVETEFAGTELPLSMLYVTLNANGVSSTLDYFNRIEVPRAGAANMPAISCDIAFNMFAFDWTPFIYLVRSGVFPTASDHTVQDPEVITAIGDYENATVIDDQTLRKLHSTALYSEFGVPVI